MIRVLLVDDQELMRMGFRMVLDAHPDIEVVGEAGDGARAVQLAEQVEPDVVLMDVRMPVLDGIEATRRIIAGCDARVLVLTTFDLDEYALAALRGGASGFLLKDIPPESLVTAVRSVAGGDAVVAPSVTRRLLERFLDTADGGSRDRAVLDVLTEREREVLALVGRGLNNQELAARLHVSEATVKTHIGRVLAKLGVRDRVQAVILAYETGLVRPGAR
ncbi:response regulator [Saccharopolyspora gloriosae]|uniref:DNA-binding NarL/FixJ family response regulator n=1 Tax=Saccharopolyspora gloriosae TaxID=455344 RepID=A0A840NRQ6_9PSEU|nr:response regulator transcription factor [Saccharopolyspora gloriosae]MBB5072683.1 DNA-binding NarL/FixJ family response regulator [Saccharopolyspora gloriosae]